VTAEEMQEAITIMILNRIDELQRQIDRANDHSEGYKLFARKREAEYIIATCLGPNFEPRRLPK
jgi:hypothetical protein